VVRDARARDKAGNIDLIAWPCPVISPENSAWSSTFTTALVPVNAIVCPAATLPSIVSVLPLPTSKVPLPPMLVQRHCAGVFGGRAVVGEVPRSATIARSPSAFRCLPATGRRRACWCRSASIGAAVDHHAAEITYCEPSPVNVPAVAPAGKLQRAHRGAPPPRCRPARCPALGARVQAQQIGWPAEN